MKDIREILYDFDLAADRLDSKNLINLKLPAKIRILNEAQDIVFRNKVRDFEKTLEVTTELQKMVDIEFEIIPSKVNIRENIYQAKLKEVPFRIVRKYAIASKACCPPEKIALITTQTDDFEVKLGSSIVRPSFQWRRALVRTAADSLFVYSETGMKIEKVVIDQIRHPAKMDMKGYVHFNGEPSVDAGCELDELAGQIVNEAVFNTRLHAGAMNEAQAAALKINRSNP